MSRNLTLPYFPVPPAEYQQQYFAELVRSFSIYLQQQQNPGEGRNTRLVLTDLPTSATGLEPGTLYRDGEFVKVVT